MDAVFLLFRRREQHEPFGVAFAFVFAFLVSGTAEDWGLGPSEDFPSHVGERLADALGDLACEVFGEDHAFLEFFFGRFVVGFDEGDDSAIVFEPSTRRGEGAFLFGPSEVHDDQIHAFGFDNSRGWLGVERVGAFVDAGAVVLTEFPCEFAVGGVDAVDMICAVVEEAVGESAGGASEVGADESCRIEVELFECVVEFESASRDIGVCVRWGLGSLWISRLGVGLSHCWISVVEVVVSGR